MKIKAISFFIIFLCLFMVNPYVLANDNVLISKNLALQIKGIIESSENEGPMPALIKDFNADHIHQDILERTEQDTDEKFLEIAKNYKPSNYKDYAKILCPLIIKKTKETKNSNFPTIDEIANKPGSPKYKNLRKNIIFLTQYISLLFESEKNDNAAVTIIYATYYIIRDLEENYSIDLIRHIKETSYSMIASNALLKWASTPRKKSAALAKYLAKDLLQLVKNEYPLSDLLIFNIGQIYATMYGQLHIHEDDDENRKEFINRVMNSNLLKETNKILYESPKTFIDKPYYLCKNELEAYSKIFNDTLERIYNDQKKYESLIEEISKNSSSEEEAMSKLKEMNLDIADISIELNLGKIIYENADNIEKYKKHNEYKLAQMEIAAIALAYNAYYCENGQEPESIETLEKWFGEKLPVNRFTGNPYTLRAEKDYVIYNYGNDNKKDEDNTKSYGQMGPQKDIFFKFYAQ
jgi:hypothetical protein